jgi:molybdopterin converting factor subunit 1
MTIHIQYFAVLREQRGLLQETLQTSAETPTKLYAELAERHSFSLDPKLVRAAVNGEFVPLDTALQEGDQVVFIPPVAGG